jgi:hypothetical protein
MASKKNIPGESAADRTRAMNAFMAHLKHPMKAEISAVRVIIKQAHEKVAERVKWDAPMFYYREDLATFDLSTMKSVHLVLLGEQAQQVRAADGLVHEDHEGRRAMSFRNMSGVVAKKGALTMFVKEWVQAIEARRPAPPADGPAQP